MVSTCDLLPRGAASVGLTGEGARLYGGRFNDYVVMAIRIAGRRVSRRLDTDLAGVNHFTADRFRTSFYRCPVLRVASVIVPREYNFVLLPEGDGFDAMIEWIEPLSFDSRLFSLIAS